ncbi:MAG: dockerin type I domain-containing protein [Planctomycetota bacterium]
MTAPMKELKIARNYGEKKSGHTTLLALVVAAAPAILVLLAPMPRSPKENTSSQPPPEAIAGFQEAEPVPILKDEKDLQRVDFPRQAQACCMADGSCQVLDHMACVAAGGDPQGPGTICTVGLCAPLKWSQPPVFNPISPHPECFWGWDVESWFDGPQIVADDWACLDQNPVADIHWWGSYEGWEGIDPPLDAPPFFHIGIWTDMLGPPFSHPGVMIWQWTNVPRSSLNERPVACDFHPDAMPTPDGCFRYDFTIPVAEWFHQGPACNIYWVSIAAAYPGACACDGDINGNGKVQTADLLAVMDCLGQPPIGACIKADVNCDGVIDNADVDAVVCLIGGQPPQVCCPLMLPPPEFNWGWKTRPHFFMDDAVQIFSPTAPFPGSPFEMGEPIERQGESWDMAFTITTQNPEACCDPFNGLCENMDPVLCAAIDRNPQGPGTACTNLDACCLPDGSCLMLDPQCCDDLGGIAQGPFSECTAPQACCLGVGTCADIDPLCCTENGGTPQGAGTTCFEAPRACCLPNVQDPDCVNTYPVCCDDWGGQPSPTGEPICLGDANGNGQDDACETAQPIQACCLPNGTCVDVDHNTCLAQGGDPQGPGTLCLSLPAACRPLKWSQPPTFNPASSHPECFWGWDELSRFAGQQIVADDWLCDNAKPVTDIHWWGSYLGWSGVDPPAIAPSNFHIGLWTDVPFMPPGFSHPGVMIAEWLVPRAALNERPVACDFHPLYMPSPEGCFRYDWKIPDGQFFYQEDTCNVYWVSISAMYFLPVEPQFPWGWKTRQHFFMDDAVRIFAPTAPVLGIPFMFGEPILDLLGESWDMAFVITTCKTQMYADIYPITGDGIVDVDDLITLLNGFIDLPSYPEADIYPCNGGDGIVDVDDLISMLQAYAGNLLCPDPCQVVIGG